MAQTTNINYAKMISSNLAYLNLQCIYVILPNFFQIFIRYQQIAWKSFVLQKISTIAYKNSFGNHQKKGVYIRMQSLRKFFISPSKMCLQPIFPKVY